MTSYYTTTGLISTSEYTDTILSATLSSASETSSVAASIIEYTTTMDTVTSSATLAKEMTSSMATTIYPTSTTSLPASRASCHCWCTDIAAHTNDSLTELVKQLNTELIVDKKKTSLYKRKLSCASDDRLSSRNIGVFGVVILVFCLCVIISMDMPRLKQVLYFCMSAQKYCFGVNFFFTLNFTSKLCSLT